MRQAAASSAAMACASASRRVGEVSYGVARETVAFGDGQQAFERPGQIHRRWPGRAQIRRNRMQPRQRRLGRHDLVGAGNAARAPSASP